MPELTPDRISAILGLTEQERKSRNLILDAISGFNAMTKAYPCDSTLATG